MHRISATPGGWNFQDIGTIFIQQTSAPIVCLSAADTDIQTLAAAVKQLPVEFPSVRVVNLLQLQQQLSIDIYAEEVLGSAQVIILRLLGGRAYWSYGLEVLKETVENTGAALIVLPGDDRPDPDLIGHSTISLAVANQLWRYFTEGGIVNFTNALKFVADACLGSSYNPPPPQAVPLVGLIRWNNNSQQAVKKVGILFYRAHYLAGNIAPIDALSAALAERQLEPLPLFVSSLRDREVQAEVNSFFQSREIDLLLNTTSFSIARLDLELPSMSLGAASPGSLMSPGRTSMPTVPEKSGCYAARKIAQTYDAFRTHGENPEGITQASSKPGGHHSRTTQETQRATRTTRETSELDLWKSLDVPVLQVIFSGGTVAQWQSGTGGLTPRDVAMNVALPEVDGRIISRAVSFKAVQNHDQDLETDVVIYQPERSRINFVADLAANWVRLGQTPAGSRKIALILANYPTRDGRLANGVGLDTPASCVEILKALSAAGYLVENIPAKGDELIQRLTAGATNDPEEKELRSIEHCLPLEEYREYFANLPPKVQQEIGDRWRDCTEKNIPIPGIRLGNIFVGIQPARGYDIDPALNYHAPDLEPTHAYLAFYYWLRQGFGAHAIVHLGKHGNLEWLPGKSVALSDTCYPEIALGAMPHFYPFIVNDPGEGSQAKRRSQAVIIDHLTPPMTRAELYGPLQQLESLIDEYYEAQMLDPSRLPPIRDRITSLFQEENLHQDLALVKSVEFTELLKSADGYLCELKEAQIRDGLHIFGQCPQGRQLRDLMVAISRGRTTGITRSLAVDWGLDFDPLTADLAQTFLNQRANALRARYADGHLSKPCFTVGDVIAELEEKAAELVQQLIESHQCTINNVQFIKTQEELNWIGKKLLPALQETKEEITQLLRGLDGLYVPSGPAGAPTRGRPEVLPTGRNFYSVDIRAIPTETAWDIGRKAAEALIESYTQENGEYPQTLGLSVWGTSTMRSGGDDIAEALALLGVQPVWDGPGRRVVDFEILPISFLGRPRVDVTLRISGFFRDAFANLIDLFDRAVAAVAALDEPPEDNPLASQVQQETQFWLAEGLTQSQAEARSRYRVFGSKPGAYGAGLQGLIAAQNWTDDRDLARAYINWSSYAYTKNNMGHAAPEAFEQRLQQMQIVLHNQDNREHDLLDSDDYYQFQGGLTAAVRSLTGKNPQTYFGDNSVPQNPRVRQLRSEIARVYRSRVVNPKWIAGVMRHGYKGAFEIAATVDYLFAYDATANCVEDYMYQGVADAYLLDPAVQEFIHEKNPWALRDMAERLLEAHQRGFWQNVDGKMVDQLRAIAHLAEGAIEDTLPIRKS